MMLQSRCSPCGAVCVSRRAPVVGPLCSTSGRQHPHRAAVAPLRSQTEGTEPATLPVDEDSQTARKKAEAERLRAAEKFMVVGAGTATCTGCGYEYKPERGDPDFPIAKGMNFQDVPADYFCPICGAPKSKFEAQIKVVAGFAENQRYGLGTNSMTGEQKSLLIYGSLALFFLLFIAGYGLN